jgi:hypothetical protein
MKRNDKTHQKFKEVSLLVSQLNTDNNDLNVKHHKIKLEKDDLTQYI